MTKETMCEFARRIRRNVARESNNALDALDNLKDIAVDATTLAFCVLEMFPEPTLFDGVKDNVPDSETGKKDG